jgi:hypothetical protein
MSEDYWDDAVHAARWVGRRRELQREAFDIALEMSDAMSSDTCCLSRRATRSWPNVPRSRESAWRSSL